MARATSPTTVTTSSARATPVTAKSVGPVQTTARMTAPATRIIVTSAVRVMSIHRLSRKDLLKRKRLLQRRACGSLKNTLTTEKMTYDEVFSRMDWQGAGLKEIEANAKVVVEMRNPALLWER